MDHTTRLEVLGKCGGYSVTLVGEIDHGTTLPGWWASVTSWYAVYDVTGGLAVELLHGFVTSAVTSSLQ